MSKSQTPKSNFPSRYSTGFISPQQFVVECLCELIAKQDRKKLPYKFWDLPEWNKIYRQHITVCNRLRRTYPIEVILETLKDKSIQNSKCRSFYFPPFVNLLKLNMRRKDEIIRKYHPVFEASPIVEPIKADITSRPSISPINHLKSL